MPMPLSATVKRHAVAGALGGDRDLRRAVAGHELERVADQVLEQLAELLLVAEHGRQLARRDAHLPAPCTVPSGLDHAVDERAVSTGSSGALAAAGARVGEQVRRSGRACGAPSTAKSMNSSASSSSRPW